MTMENLDEKPMGSNNFDDNQPSQNIANPGERFVAFLIDWILAAIVIKFIPYAGYLVGVAYILTRDALPFLDGMSVGKKLMKLRAIDEETGEKLTDKWDKSVLRNVSLIIPIFNIVDGAMVLTDEKKRFGDKWGKTIVIKDENA